jgi:hypothetical protein
MAHKLKETLAVINALLLTPNLLLQNEVRVLLRGLRRTPMRGQRKEISP